MFGYVLAMKRAQVIAVHDCDITTYNREMLTRLIYPVVHPGLDFKYSKGFYSRVANRKMNGRVCRLLIPPLLRALEKVCGPSDYLSYMDSFKYVVIGVNLPFSRIFCMTFVFPRTGDLRWECSRKFIEISPPIKFVR